MTEHAEESFESSQETRYKDKKKTWQDIITHKVMGVVYQKKYERSGKCLEEADFHLQRGFKKLPQREDLSVTRRKRATQYLYGCIDYAKFQFIGYNDAEKTINWYKEAKDFLDGLPEGQCPKESEKLRKLSGGALVVCYASLQSQNLKRIRTYGNEALSYYKERLNLDEGSRKSTIHHLTSFLFIYGDKVSGEQRAVLAEEFAEDIGNILSRQWRTKTIGSGYKGALRGFVAVADKYGNYVNDSDKDQIVESIRETYQLKKRKLRQKLEEWKQDKKREGNPVEFNRELLNEF